MASITNEEKAQEIANDKKIIGLNKFGRLDIEATKWMSALEAMEWKDEQFKEMLQALPKSVQDLITELI